MTSALAKSKNTFYTVGFHYYLCHRLKGGGMERIMKITEKNISIITDELSRDFETASSILSVLDIRKIELRNMRTGRVPYISDSEKEEIKKYISKYNLKINAISPGIGKLKINSDNLKEKTIKHLMDSIDFADEFGVEKIIIFSFKKNDIEDKTEVIPKFVVDIIKEIIKIGKAHNKQILLENQSTCYVSTFDSIIDIIEQINDEKFKLNWDPYNSFQIDKQPCGCDMKTLVKYIENIHIKDGEYNKEFIRKPIGRGMIGWSKILKQLMELGYSKEITIETHYEPLIFNTIKDYDELMKLLGLKTDYMQTIMNYS